MSGAMVVLRRVGSVAHVVQYMPCDGVCTSQRLCCVGWVSYAWACLQASQQQQHQLVPLKGGQAVNLTTGFCTASLSDNSVVRKCGLWAVDGGISAHCERMLGC
jgi:hypothetical protein